MLTDRRKPSYCWGGECGFITIMENGFAIVGKPSCSVSQENDNAELGEKIAIDNSQGQVWELEGYALKQKLYNEELTHKEVE